MWLVEKEENLILLKYLLLSLLKKVISIQISSDAQSDTIPVNHWGAGGAAWGKKLKAFFLLKIYIPRPPIPLKL